MDQPDFFTAWTEPESAANSQYQPVFPYNNATQTPGGHSFELDDTPTRERVRLQHRSGTFIEMHPNGDEVHKVYGDGYEITIGNKNMLVKGRIKIEVDGDCEIHVAGDLIEQIDGNVEQHIKGNYTQVVEGVSSRTSQADTIINAGGSYPGGGLKITTGDYTHIDGDFSVDGEITASKITSTGRVDALDGMSAGLAGFVTVLGGVSAGLPIATPGQVNAGISVSAPLGNFAVMEAIWAYDTVNLSLHNSHIHIAPMGPTTPPIPLEVGA
jgi:hypothetical protein